MTSPDEKEIKFTKADQKIVAEEVAQIDTILNQMVMTKVQAVMMHRALCRIVKSTHSEKQEAVAGRGMLKMMEV